MKEGRPTKLRNGRGANVSLYIDPTEMNMMEEIRWREHKSMSEIVRKAISEYIKSHGSGNETFKLDNWENPDFKAIPTILSRSESWYHYLEECTEQELTDIMLKTMSINKQCQNIKLVRK